MTQSLNLLVTPTEFFREKVSKALFSQNLTVSGDVEFYLVNLLCTFIEPEKLSTSTGEIDPFDIPLALMLKSALEAAPSDQLKIYKTLGDTSLYISGYFQDYFNRKCFDLDYFIQIGSNAYNNVSKLMREKNKGSPVYEFLSDQFPMMVEVVAEVSDELSEPRDINILAVYDRWTRNQSERLRKKLKQNGINPIPVNSKSRQ